jgi:hypothetical protein
MKRFEKSLFCLVVLLFTVCINLFSQATTASTTGQITAEVIPVFSAVETSQLNFGRFAPGPQGGEIILTPQNTISVMGTVFIGTGVHNAASFYVTGDADASFSISLPVNPVILTHRTSSARTMLVDNWISVPAPGIGTGMLRNGYQTVYVGATLKVGTLNDNPMGIYTGSYEIKFDFN